MVKVFKPNEIYKCVVCDFTTKSKSSIEWHNNSERHARALDNKKLQVYREEGLLYQYTQGVEYRYEVDFDDCIFVRDGFYIAPNGIALNRKVGVKGSTPPNYYKYGYDIFKDRSNMPMKDIAYMEMNKRVDPDNLYWLCSHDIKGKKINNFDKYGYE